MDMEILHVFADHGAEAVALSEYGNVTRVTINPRENEYSDVIQADARSLPFSDSTQFDLGLFHPPCTKWSTMPSADTENAPNFIPLSREIGEQYCDEWIIENKPSAPLEDATRLNGKMFGIPIKYERAFESTFDLTPTPSEQDIETEISPYFYSDRTKEWWCAVKNLPTDFPKQHTAKNALPLQYVNFLMRRYFETTNERDGDLSRSCHGDPDPKRLS